MTYQSALTLRQHQIDGVNKARGKHEFAYLCDYGVGKSAMLLTEYGELEAAGEVDDLLIIAPAGCYQNWVWDKGEFQFSEVKKNFSQELRNRTIVGFYWSSQGKRNKEALDWLLSVEGRPRVLVVNVEALSRPGYARQLCHDFLYHRRVMMAVDESTTIKGYNSERTKTIIALGRVALYRRILTGMATPNSPMDLYSQFEFLNWRILGQRSFYGFRARYAVLKAMQFGGRREATQVIVGYRNEAELAERIAPYSFRVTKEECLDLPPKVYATRDVEMTHEQARVYREMRDQAFSQLDSGQWVSAQMALTLVTRLHQVLCGHVRDDDGLIRTVESNRIKTLLSVLDEISGKVIIWACYDVSIKEIAFYLGREFGEESVAKFWGGNTSTRAEEERRWLGDTRCRFMVATPASGGRGNTWTVAQDEVYYSNGYNLEHRLNSEDRAHRIGQTGTVTITDLVCWDTVDETILKALRRKIDLASTINQDNWKEWVL